MFGPSAKHESMIGSRLTVRVRSIRYEAEGINAYELVHPDGAALPAFAAGAHIDVHLKKGLIRQYSLCNDPVERHRYRIAVLNEPDGRGGSRAMHREVRAGDLLTISKPRNNFPLASAARRHLLLAGGIGITPMLAMLFELRRGGVPFTLHYCTRSPARTAFLEELAPFLATGTVALHHDGGDPRNGLDLAETLKAYEPGTHLYYCGPPGFMAAVKVASAHWPKGSVHREYFTPSDDTTRRSGGAAFKVKLVSSGAIFDVPADQTIVEVLRRNGVEIETSCEDGYCGTCMTRYLEGEPEHRDTVLDEEDRREYALICCARSKTPLLVLDL
jgi:vanillate O-demethylase ferredoxin subunit